MDLGDPEPTDEEEALPVTEVSSCMMSSSFCDKYLFTLQNTVSTNKRVEQSQAAVLQAG